MDIQLHYTCVGEGPVLILLHGNGEDSSFFESQIEEFSQDFCVCAIDTRGHGLSPRGVYEEKISELQQRLMENGCFLPYNKRNTADFIRNAKLTPGCENLRNGIDRTNHTYGDGDMGATIPLGKTWATPSHLPQT
ncbi:MAG: alpha/beta hydrolase [Clostridia bacterium]|nr:alpha/beta hydrolase [Clostridia bacterium]